MIFRSSYFQQIEEDVHKYSKQITEMKSSISNFKTNDMRELVNLHNAIESVLEHLTDESQVSSIHTRTQYIMSIMASYL